MWGWREGKFDIFLSSDCHYQSLYFFLFFFGKVVKTLSWSFSFAIWANGNAKKKYNCGTLPFTALGVNQSISTSAVEKPGNVKKVYSDIWSHFQNKCVNSYLNDIARENSPNNLKKHMSRRL